MPQPSSRLGAASSWGPLKIESTSEALQYVDFSAKSNRIEVTLLAVANCITPEAGPGARYRPPFARQPSLRAHSALFLVGAVDELVTGGGDGQAVASQSSETNGDTSVSPPRRVTPTLIGPEDSKSAARGCLLRFER